jgi:DNA adenine methylase
MAFLSPLRYPGGKSKLAPVLKSIARKNALLDGVYVEPFAGGFGAGLSLLFNGYMNRVVINDLSPAIYSFWKACLLHTDEFCRRVECAELSITEWRRQKEIFTNATTEDVIDLGFSAFYLNRTNKSGVLNGGPIGGIDQGGNFKIDARFNKTALIDRISMIARLKSRITIFNEDASNIDYSEFSDGKHLIYFDPPYYEKGRNLYYDYFNSSDHNRLAQIVSSLDGSINWLVSYDNVEPISKLYQGFNSVTFGLGYSVRDAKFGNEILFHSSSLSVSKCDFELAGRSIKVA